MPFPATFVPVWERSLADRCAGVSLKFSLFFKNLLIPPPPWYIHHRSYNMKKYRLFTLIFTLLTAVACPPPPAVPENPTDTDGGAQGIVYRFEPNGGSGSAFDYTVRFAEEFTFPENPFKRENYAFVGWSTNKNATSSNQLSQPGEKELVSSKSPYTYYAIWERGRMTVTYNPMVENGKTVTVDALNQDGYIVLADGGDLFAVKESGKYFAGWRTEPGESGEILGPGTALGAGAAAVFYAAYESAEPETKSVSFDIDWGSGWEIDAESPSYEINEYTRSIRLPDVKEREYSDITADFLGWALTENAAEAEYLPGEIIQSPMTSLEDDGYGNVSIYAVLKERPQSAVTFDLNTAENPGAEWNPNSSDYYSKPLILSEGNELSLPSDWNTVSSNEEIRLFGWEWNGTVYESGETFTVPASAPNITFTAVWKTPVAVKWNLNGARMSDYYKIIVADDPDVDADRNGVADELESALPGDEILFSDDMLRLMCTKPPLEGKAWGLDGIQIKKTKSGQTVNVTRTVDSYYYDEYDFVLHYTQYAFVMPEEEVEVSLIWKEVPAELDLKILDSDSSSLAIADPGTVSLDTENFSIVNNAGEEQIFSTYFGDLRYFYFGDLSSGEEHPLAPGEYRLQFLVDGEVKNETSFIVKDEEDEAPLEFAFGEAAVTVEDNHYVLTVPYTHNRDGYFYINAVLSVNDKPTDKYGSVDYEKQTVTFDDLYGDEYNYVCGPDDELTVEATVEGEKFSVSATVPADEFCLYPSNETAQIALFRESESSYVSVSVPIERIFGIFTDFDVTVTKGGSAVDSVYPTTSRKADGLFSIEFNIYDVTSGDYTLEIVPSGKASPKVECTITVNEIPVGKRIYLSPKRK